jgi:hypothetical protein
MVNIGLEDTLINGKEYQEYSLERKTDFILVSTPSMESLLPQDAE